MLISNYYKISLLLVLVVKINFSKGTLCTNKEWSCNSGQCIASNLLCDGKTDCSDGSDETMEVCIQQSCPTSAYRCGYGACVSGSAKCNGIKECADNSDEMSSLCANDMKTKNSLCKRNHYTHILICPPEEHTSISSTTTSSLISEPRTRCTNSEWSCKSGQCIASNLLCDGKSECSDGSDEIMEVCIEKTCPSSAYRCAYGACVSGSAKCNGIKECADNSDEESSICPNDIQARDSLCKRNHYTHLLICPPGVNPSISSTRTNSEPIKPTKSPPTSLSTQPTVDGCRAPNISNSILKNEAEPAKLITPGEIVADGTSMIYECVTGYFREGPQFNLCVNSKWYSALDAKCVKYCPNDKLKGVTFRAVCQKHSISVSCDERISPGTIARLFCQQKYRKPPNDPPDILLCQEDGQWNYEPFRCEPVCGKELVVTTAFSVNSVETNITYVPWHVGIYQNLAGSRFKHVCGGTIVAAKVVITAAHCFWNFADQKLLDKSYYVVGAGKYLRDYYEKEQNAAYENISEIAVPADFFGDIENYKSDIAVLVLKNFLKFSPFIAPACIEWQNGELKSIESNVYGQISGWGIDNSGDFSKVLRSIEAPSSSYSDCRTTVGPKLANAVSHDKFCVINTSGSVVCQGDSGGGFIVKKVVNGENINYLWGIVTGGVPQGYKCSEYLFISYTNIQYFESLIMSRINLNIPR